MKKIVKLFIIISLFIINPLEIRAVEIDEMYCTDTQKNIQMEAIDYTNFIFYEENGSIKLNVDREMTFIDIYDATNKKYYYEGITKYSYNSSIKQNSVIKIEFYSNVVPCVGEKIGELELETPTLNKFYEHEACDGVYGYTLCDKWYNNNLSEADFIYYVDLYKNSYYYIDENEVVYFFDKVLNFLFEYYLVITLPIIIVGTGLIIFIIYSEKKKSLI